MEPWRQWCTTLLLTTLSRDGKIIAAPGGDSLGESPAFEVLKFREKEGFFANSAEIRNPKPPFVKYRVGQVRVSQPEFLTSTENYTRD